MKSKIGVSSSFDGSGDEIAEVCTGLRKGSGSAI